MNKVVQLDEPFRKPNSALTSQYSFALDFVIPVLIAQKHANGVKDSRQGLVFGPNFAYHKAH